MAGFGTPQSYESPSAGAGLYDIAAAPNNFAPNPGYNYAKFGRPDRPDLIRPFGKRLVFHLYWNNNGFVTLYMVFQNKGGFRFRANFIVLNGLK